MHKPPCFSSSVSASGLDAAGGRAPTCTHSPEVLAPGVPLGQVRLHQLSCRRELDGAPACPAQGSGVPSPKGQSLLGSHGAAPFLCVTAGFPRLPCTGVPSRRESLAALSARCVPALGSGWPYSFYLHVLLDLGSIWLCVFITAHSFIQPRFTELYSWLVLLSSEDSRIRQTPTAASCCPFSC